MTVQITLPNWVVHRADDKSKRTTIYSLSLHPDGSRLATGGIGGWHNGRVSSSDTKIRIWATQPILDANAEAGDTPRLLSTLSRHTGAVLAVRWSHSGRFLASGSDDAVAVVWDLDVSGTGSGPTFGTTEMNVEHWRPHRRLPGHDSDVTDLAWAPADEYLATVGLDSMVMIWSGDTFERVRALRGHQGFIKGVSFDPLGQFLATAGDDRNVKVWRTEDWGLEAVVSEPFRRSPTSTFFQRPSWTPDGSNLLTANAMNGPVFVASIVQRTAWTFPISLVGHENAVTVAACSPQLFRSEGGGGGVASVVALGAQDQNISVWLTGAARPVLVARGIFERGVMDLSWSADGYTLYACSSDGSVAAFVFSVADLAPTLPASELSKIRAAYGLKERVRTMPSALPRPLSTQQPHTLAPRRVGTNRPARLTQCVTRNKDGRRRIIPTRLDGGHAAVAQLEAPAEEPPPDGAGAADPMASAMKRRAPPDEAAPPSLPKLVRTECRSHGRVVGGDVRRGAEPATELVLAPAMPLPTAPPATAPPLTAPRLTAPPLWTSLHVPIDGGTLDVRNHATTKGPSEIALLGADGSAQWLDFVPSPVAAVAGTASFAAAMLHDRTLVWYSRRGRRLGTLALDGVCVQMDAAGCILAVLLQDGSVRRWNMAEARELPAPVRVPHVADDAVHSFFVHVNGIPVVVLRDRQEAYALDPAKGAFVCIASAWFAAHSRSWDSRLRGRAAGAARDASREPVRLVESELNTMLVDGERGAAPRPEVTPRAAHADFALAVTLRHLETRVDAALLLDSPIEFRQGMHALARKLGEEGLRAQAEELLRPLLGPVYYRPDADEQWDPTVLGMSKRELLGSVLQTMGKGRLLNSLVQSYQEALRAVQT
ncbi:HIR complex subunit [Malassezia sp. CBS 17886]|nr:HIR complex subunit [Malassezia sp. CBS 17886]